MPIIHHRALTPPPKQPRSHKELYTTLLNEKCVVCGDEAQTFTHENVFYCKTHQPVKCVCGKFFLDSQYCHECCSKAFGWDTPIDPDTLLIKCVGCLKMFPNEEMAEDSEHGVMGQCRTCDKCFACADCIIGWTHKERYYCKEHEGDYDETKSEWATPASSKQSSQDYEAQVERHMEMMADIARGK